MPDGRVLAAASLVLAVYVAVLLAMPPGGFYSPDEGTKFLQMRSIGWNDGFTYTVPYGGAAIDPELAFYPTRCRHEDLYPVRLPDGGVKLHWPIWFSLITHVPVTFFGLRGLYVVPLLSGWLIALLSGRLARVYDRRLSPHAILTVGLATPIAFFSLTHWEHTLAALLGLAALALVAETGLPVAKRWLAAPLLLAAVVLRIELAPFAVAVAAGWWAARRITAGPRLAGERRLGLWLAVAATTAAVIVAAVTGFIPARHLWLLQEFPTYAYQNVVKLPYLPATLVATLIDAPGNQAPELGGALRIVALVAVLGAVGAPFLRHAQAQAALGLVSLFVLLDCCVLIGMMPQIYISLHGFVPVSPFVVLAAWAVPDAWRTRRPDRTALTTAAAVYLLLGLLLLFTYTVEPDGTYRTGLEWGNRYLLTLYPLATVLALGGVQIWRSSAEGTLRRVLTAIVAGLLLCSLWMEVRGLWVLHRSRTLATTWQTALPRDAPVVTDVWWLAAAMAPYFETHPMHCVRDPADLAIWLTSAHARGVDEFTFASFKPIRAERFAGGPIEIEGTATEFVSGLHVTRLRVKPAE